MNKEHKICAHCERLIRVEEEPDHYKLENAAYFCSRNCENRYYNGVEGNYYQWHAVRVNR
jgi:hypothetical protein